MAKARKAKLHTSIPQEWKRFLVKTVKRLNALADNPSSGKQTQETVIVRALQLLRDSLEESGLSRIVENGADLSDLPQPLQ